MDDAARKKFTFAEKELLFRILEKYKDITDNRHTNAAALKKKHQTWKLIAREYNENPLITYKRTYIQLMHLYKNIRSRARKVNADENILEYIERERFLRQMISCREKELTFTGGIGFVKPTLTDTEASKPQSFEGSIIPTPTRCYDSAEDFFPSHKYNDGRIQNEVVNEQLDSNMVIKDDDDDESPQSPINTDVLLPQLSETSSDAVQLNLKRKKKQMTEETIRRKMFITKLRTARMEYKYIKTNLELTNKTLLINYKTSVINLKTAELKLKKAQADIDNT